MLAERPIRPNALNSVCKKRIVRSKRLLVTILMHGALVTSENDSCRCTKHFGLRHWEHGDEFLWEFGSELSDDGHGRFVEMRN